MIGNDGLSIGTCTPCLAHDRLLRLSTGKLVIGFESPAHRTGTSQDEYEQVCLGVADKLELICQLVAQTIDTDWMRLYHALPFHPPRGHHIITDDIDEISTRFMRHNMEEQARQSLARWRRLHTRACTEDVRIALQAVKRQDVLDRLDTALTPRARPTVAPKRHRTVHFPKLPANRTR